MPETLERVCFWRGCERVLYSFPRSVQEGFLWVFEKLERDPVGLPCAASRFIAPVELHGVGGALRVAVRRDPRDPGFRGIYVGEKGKVTFLRFRDRESEPYRELGKLLRAHLTERSR